MKLIGLDVGTKRIGVAKVDSSVKIAVPECTINVDGHELQSIARLSRQIGTDIFVVGLPRNNSGDETKQSAYSRHFAETLKDAVPDAKIYFQDESFTSVEAENRLKQRKKRYAKGEIDAEAAAIILQDFVEGFSAPENSSKISKNSAIYAKNTPETGKNSSKIAPESPVAPVKSASAAIPPSNTITIKKGPKMSKKAPKLPLIVLSIVVICAVLGFFTFYWYIDSLKPIYNGDCASENSPDECTPVSFTVAEGESAANIADNLASAGLIKSSLSFQVYLRFSGNAENIRSGNYVLRKNLSVQELVNIFITGPKEEVFSLMLRPGDTLMDLKETLLSEGYSETEVDTALQKSYDFPVLKDKPAGVSLEGYLYGDTYEFYKGESVENIIKRLLEEMQTVVDENGLEAAFEAQGLNLHEGITLASIVQKESIPSAEDYAKVAQVFLSRLEQGVKLGSDVTTQYALDLIDPDRNIYTDNAAALAVDSPYNTRKYSGLPPGAIASPSLSALKAVAHPSDTEYFYFLTGDDGMMYYSYTESEHNQNASKYCQELCNVSL